MNDTWQKHVHMPSYLSSYGVSEEVEGIIEKELSNILYSALQKVRTKDDKDIDHNTTLMGTYMQSVLHTSSQKNNISYTQTQVNSLRCMRDCTDVCASLGSFASYGVSNGLIQVGIGPRETDVNTLYVTLSPGDLILPDTTYYLDKSQTMVRTLEAYVKLLMWLGEEFGIEGLEQTIGLEHELALVLRRAEMERESFVSGATLSRRFKHIHWEQFALQALAGMTLEKFQKTDFIISSISWLYAIDKWCSKLTIDQWRTWFSAQIIMYNLPYLPPPYDDKHYELFGRRLHAQSEKLPQKQLALYSATQILSDPCGEAYIKQYFCESTKKDVEKMAGSILETAASHIHTNEWLSDSSKKEAVRKIHGITLNIGYPRFSYDYLKDVQLSSADFLKNIYKIKIAKHTHDLKKASSKLNPHDWSEPVYSVNAFYYPEGNRLIIPAGILRSPFYDSKKLGWCYGGIGSTIGHEITHAFDMDGKEYNSDGNYKPWWSNADNAHYKKLTKKLVKLYEKSSYFGKQLDGSLTLSENIADIGGLSFSLEALKKELNNKHYSDSKRDAELRDFFSAYAVSWRTKDREEKAIQSLFMDVHAPAMVRVNNVVCQFDDWYRIFDVKPGDELYVDPQDRVRIF